MTGAEQIIYFHGLPGSVAETELFGREAAARCAGFHVAERANTHSAGSATEHFEQIAADIRRVFPSTPLRFIGFSLGAAAALRTAPFLGGQVQRIDLVSAAAPLDLGNYLGSMAGAPVFKIARASPLLFGLLGRGQGIMARLFPGHLYSALFAAAQGADAELARDPEFKARMARILRQGLGVGWPAYRREISLYTQNWQFELDRVMAPVSLIHGSDDNWSPVAMAADLAERLPCCDSLQILEGRSHYSSLGEFFRTC